MTRTELIIGAAGTIAVSGTWSKHIRRDFGRDVDFVREFIVETGAVPFATSSPTSFVRRADALRLQIHSSTLSETYVGIAELVASLNDVHCTVFPSFYARFAEAGGPLFPLNTVLLSNGLFVNADLDSPQRPIEKFSRIVAIDGISAAQLAARMTRMTGGQNADLRHAFASLRFLLFALRGPHDNAIVEWTTPSGSSGKREVRFRPSKELDEIARVVAPRPPDYELRTDGDIAILDYNACRNRPRFTGRLDAWEQQLRASRAVIIDIRRNAGGDSRLNDDLWSRFAKGPFRQFGGSLGRISARARRIFGRKIFDETFGPEAWAMADGSLYYKPEPFITPRENPARIDRPVLLLIGPGTVSSALACAIAAKEFGIARIVGEATSEPACTTGEVVTDTCPVSGLGVTSTAKFYFGSGATVSTSGIQPDEFVGTTFEDLVAGRDPVLERALALARA